MMQKDDLVFPKDVFPKSESAEEPNKKFIKGSVQRHLKSICTVTVLVHY